MPKKPPPSLPRHDRQSVANKASPELWLKRVQLLKETGTALVLWAPIVGSAILGLYFMHIGRFPTELAPLGGLAVAAFGVGVVLLALAPTVALLPTLYMRSWRLIARKAGIPHSLQMQLPPPAFFAAQVWPSLGLMAMALAQMEPGALDHHLALSTLTLGACAGLALITTIVVALETARPRDRVERLLIAFLLGFMSFISTFMLVAIASRAPSEWADSVHAVWMIVLFIVLLCNLNTVFSEVVPSIRVSLLVVVPVALLVTVLLVPQGMQQPAWLVTRVATLLGIRSDGEVPLLVPAVTAAEIRANVGACAVLAPTEDFAASAPMYRTSAQVLSNVGPIWRIAVSPLQACAASSPTYAAGTPFDVSGTGIRQLAPPPHVPNTTPADPRY